MWVGTGRIQQVSWILQGMVGKIFNQKIQEPQCYIVQRLLQNWLYFINDNIGKNFQYLITKEKDDTK